MLFTILPINSEEEKEKTEKEDIDKALLQSIRVCNGIFDTSSEAAANANERPFGPVVEEIGFHILVVSVECQCVWFTKPKRWALQ